MEKISSIINQYDEKIKYLYLSLIIIHGINCYSKLDYNVILYAFIYLSWTNSNILGSLSKQIEREEKKYSFYLLIGTFVLDIAWFFIYSGKGVYLSGIDSAMWSLCYFFSIIGVCGKIIVFLVLMSKSGGILGVKFPGSLQEKVGPTVENENFSSENRLNQGDSI